MSLHLYRADLSSLSDEEALAFKKKIEDYSFIQTVSFDPTSTEFYIDENDDLSVLNVPESVRICRIQ